MAFGNGDFLKIEYDVKRVADGALVYTTDEKKARDAGIFSEGTRYGPQLAILGEHGKRNVISGLDRELRQMSVGEHRRFELEPKDAFGERNADMVRMMPTSEFRKSEVNPYPGMQIELDGRPAVVKSVNSGRVMVDSNHPLAGERVSYEVKVLSKIDSDTDKLMELSEYYGAKADRASAEGKKATAEYGEKVDKNADYFINKAAFIKSAFTFLGMEKVRIVEEYNRVEEARQSSAAQIRQEP